jgi:hypothetical protein
VDDGHTTLELVLSPGFVPSVLRRTPGQVHKWQLLYPLWLTISNKFALTGASGTMSTIASRAPLQGQIKLIIATYIAKIRKRSTAPGYIVIEFYKALRIRIYTYSSNRSILLVAMCLSWLRKVDPSGHDGRTIPTT